MRLLYLSITQTTALIQGLLVREAEERILEYFPGSVIYGPGHPGYQTADVREILEEYGGENNFDAIFCVLPERELAGEPLGLELPLKASLPSHLWHFPLHLEKTKLPKILVGDDFWHLTPRERNRVLLANKFCLYISAFLSPFIIPEAMRHYFSRDVWENVIFMPVAGSASENIYIPDLKKKHDVLLAGYSLPAFYPVRAQMAQAFRKSGLALCEPRHPGYSHLKTVSPPSTYLKDLARSRISAFCTSQFHFTPLKLFEAMASRTIALCDAPCGYEHLGLEADKHFILADSGNCVEKAQRWLSDPDLYAETTEAAYRLFRSRHTLRIRTKELAEQIPPILDGGRTHGWIDLSPNFRLVRALSRSKNVAKPTAPRVYKKEWWQMVTTLDRETWHYWHQLFPLQYLDSETRKTVILPDGWDLRTAALGHMEAFRAQILADMVEQKNLRNLLEIGTGSGYHSILWAERLHTTGVVGSVFAEDPVPGDQLIMLMSPQYLQMTMTRDLLWAGIPAAQSIHFLLRREGWHEPLQGKALDLLFFNTSPNIINDFKELSEVIKPETILAVNKYGSAYPEVMHAVQHMAESLGRDIVHIDFSPCDSGLALLFPQQAGKNPQIRT